MNHKTSEPRISLPEKIARKLADEIHHTPGLVRLPPIYELARTHMVAYGTMRKAIRILVSRGLVESSPGRGILVSSSIKTSALPSDREQALYESIRRRVLEGVYCAGEPLPKVNYFAKTECVSPNAILHVFRSLESEHIIHKKGKFWFSGPASLQSGCIPFGREKSREPVVLLLVDNNVGWDSVFTTPFTSPFAFTLQSELTKYSVQLHCVLARRVRAPTLSVASGIQEARTVISDLGSRYSGTLFFCGPNRQEVANLDEWIVHLNRFGKPVVYFDFAGRSPLFSRAKQKRLSHFFRLFRDEDAAITLALNTLISLGHTSIAIPDFPSWDWIAGRIERMRSIARTLEPSLSIHVPTHRESFWKFGQRGIYDFPIDKPSSKDDEKPSVSRSSIPTDTTSRILLENTPSLAPLLLEEKITALVAPCDAMGIRYHFWMKHAGFSVPQSVSLLSFDNNFLSSVFPITSIDFGFSRLGYLAAHLFIGDMPDIFGKKRNIPGPCTLINRGSLGRIAETK